MQNYFLEMAKLMKKFNTGWPWREYDIKYGDFERTYLKIAFEKNNYFKENFNIKEKNMEVTFWNWEFQFGNILHDFDTRK
jgi:hypothetical protein